MNNKYLLSIIVVGLACVALGSTPVIALADNPMPVISSISPASLFAGSSATTLTVNGSNFVPGAVVTFGGSSRTTTYISSTQLTASLPASDFSTVGSYNVAVNNPTPGGGTSASVVFNVVSTTNNPIPFITSISPSLKAVGDPAFTMTVYGSNFVSGSQVRFNGLPRATTYVSSTQLMATIPALALVVPENQIVTVVNPTPGGGTSNTMLFTISSNTPGLPNTGVGPADRNIGLALAAALLLAGFAVALINRSKRAVV